MIANLFGPIEGRRHESAMVAQSQILQQVHVHSFESNNNTLCFYGDRAYTIRTQIYGPFQGANLTDLAKSME